MDKGAWQTTVHEIAKSQTRLRDCARARTHTHTHTHTQWLTEYELGKKRMNFLKVLAFTSWGDWENSSARTEVKM